MEQYISKAAIVTEIEKLIDEIYAGRPFDSLSSEQQTALWYVKSIMSSINNLEVKEVDFEKEIDKFYGMYRKDGQTFNLEDNEECVDWKVDCNPKFEKSFAKYFFELGLKAQKGEEV